MGKRGPKPEPNEIKKLRGSKYFNPDEPDMPAAINLCPPRGRLSQEARRFWKSNVEILSQKGILKETDLAAFELMCTHYGFAIAAARIIKEEGMLTIDERGLARKHPAMQLFRDQSALFLKYASLFGLDPSSRGNLHAEEPDEKSLAQILYEGIDDSD
jgi:P27 family predicted phage terminase small subunit